MKSEFNQSKYIQGYMKENTVTKRVLFSRKKPEDVEMIRWLEENKINFSGMVKEIIKEKMEEMKMKKITIEEVAKQLSENVSIEFQDENTATYFLHLDEDGHLESFGNVVFHTDRDVSGMTKEEIYGTETLDNPDFKAICKDLAEQANEWMSENQ